jgi:hypothetical protein
MKIQPKPKFLKEETEPCEEPEALERRVIVKSIQQGKLETDGG